MNCGTKIVFLFGFLLVAVLGFSQDEYYNQVDNQGRKIGKWKAEFENGMLRYEGQFRNDRPYGEFRHYFNTGELRAINLYSMNGKVAHNQTFSSDGTLLAEGKYINQKKDSTWRFYSDIDGVLISEEDYHIDMLYGEVKNYYPENGSLAEITYYNNGKKEGLWKRYFPDGSLMTQGLYKNDLLDGALIIYHPNGNIQISGQYEIGVRNGTWLTYDQDGELIDEEVFD